MVFNFSEYMCYVYVRGDNLAGVLITDHDYPQRISHTLITKVMLHYSSFVFKEKKKNDGKLNKKIWLER